MPHCHEPIPLLGRGPKRGNGTIARSCGNALWYGPYIQCPTQEIGAWPRRKASFMVGLTSPSRNQLCTMVRAWIDAALFRTPCAVRYVERSIRSPPADHTIGAKP